MELHRFKVCEEKLATAEKRIDIINRNAAGESQVEEFEPETKPAAAPREEANLFRS